MFYDKYYQTCENITYAERTLSEADHIFELVPGFDDGVSEF